MLAYPIGSMYGIFTYIWVIYGVNVGKYSIHGAYGYIPAPWILWVFNPFRLWNFYAGLPGLDQDPAAQQEFLRSGRWAAGGPARYKKLTRKLLYSPNLMEILWKSSENHQIWWNLRASLPTYPLVNVYSTVENPPCDFHGEIHELNGDFP